MYLGPYPPRGCSGPPGCRPSPHRSQRDAPIPAGCPSSPALALDFLPHLCPQLVNLLIDTFVDRRHEFNIIVLNDDSEFLDHRIQCRLISHCNPNARGKGSDSPSDGQGFHFKVACSVPSAFCGSGSVRRVATGLRPALKKDCPWTCAASLPAWTLRTSRLGFIRGRRSFSLGFLGVRRYPLRWQLLEASLGSCFFCCRLNLSCLDGCNSRGPRTRRR